MASASERWPRSLDTRANWIRILARRYNQEGPAALADRRQHNPGASLLLSEEGQQQLQQALMQTPVDGSLWSGRHPLPIGWASGSGARSIPNAVGTTSKGLASLSRSLVPVITKPIQLEPRGVQARVARTGSPDPAYSSTGSSRTLVHGRASRGTEADHQTHLGAASGHRPIVRVHQRYEWLYVYGFVHPETGASQWLVLPSVNVEIFSIALQHFAQAVGAGPHRRILLVLDRVGWHESGELVIPEGIHLIWSLALLTGVAALRTSLAAHQ